MFFKIIIKIWFYVKIYTLHLFTILFYFSRLLRTVGILGQYGFVANFCVGVPLKWRHAMNVMAACFVGVKMSRKGRRVIMQLSKLQ